VSQIVTNDPQDDGQNPDPEAVRRWWEKLLAARKKGGRMVVVRSRLHEADLIGHVLDPDGAKFKELNLPERYQSKRSDDLMSEDFINDFLPKEPVDLPKDTRPFIWTDAQCFEMNAAQHDNNRHPYTCGKDSRHRQGHPGHDPGRLQDRIYKTMTKYRFPAIRETPPPSTPGDP
jgi:hypothetical protein